MRFSRALSLSLSVNSYYRERGERVGEGGERERGREREGKRDMNRSSK